MAGDAQDDVERTTPYLICGGWPTAIIRCDCPDAV